MVTAIVGRSFLAYYNQKYHTDLSAKAFFEQVYFPLFFDHSKFLIDGGNTALTNPKVPKGKSLSPEQRQERFQKLIQNIESGFLDTRTTLDFSASEAEKFATTSGQVTDLKPSLDGDTAYLSWIGNGFGIGVSGGYILLIDNPVILDALFVGWQHYRDFLNDPAYDGLPGNKIHRWNGRWLCHMLNENFRHYSPLREYPVTAFEPQPDKTIEIKSQSWLNVLLNVARQIQIDGIIAYIYMMGKTNLTYGFIPLNLCQLQRPEQVYIKLFGEGEYQNDRDKLRTLYGTAKSFQRICEMGAIGVSALEPKGLRDIMQGGKAKPTDEITFKAYITWLIAMLNNNDSWDNAGEAAVLLLRYETTTKRSKDLSTGQEHQVATVLEASTKQQFINALAKIMLKADEPMLAEMEELGKRIHHMPNDNFAYFQALIRLRYVRSSRDNTQQ